MPNTIEAHHGTAVRKIREMRGYNQQDLADHLGVTQQSVSQLENKEKLDEKILLEVASFLKVSPDAIKHFNELDAKNFFNSFYDHSVSNFGNFPYLNINPIEKIVELYEKVIVLKEEIINLKDQEIQRLSKK